MSAPRKMLNEYLAWAGLKPRTSEWSALVTLGQDQCNKVLRHEYIAKVDQNSLMPPVNSSDESSDTQWTWLIDHVFETPQLNFANDPDDQSAELNLSMALLGGKHITLDDNHGFPQVNRLSVYDRLDHPQLEAQRFVLVDVEGHGTKDGLIVLDMGDPIAQGRIWEVSGDVSQHQRRMLGNALKGQFARAEHDKRAFVLGKLAHTDQPFMKPQRFMMRTVMAQGADKRDSTIYGNGVVELRISMNDEELGGLPGPDWVFPIPSDRTDLDAMVMLGSDFFMHVIVGKGLVKAFDDPLANFEQTRNPQGFIDSIAVKNSPGYLPIPGFRIDDNGAYEFSGHLLPIYYSDEERLRASVKRESNGTPYLQVNIGSVRNFKWFTCTTGGQTYNIAMSSLFGADYLFSLDAESRKLVVKLKDFRPSVYFDPSNTNLPQNVKSLLNSVRFRTAVGNEIATQLNKAFSSLEAIDIFVLKTLMFSSEDAVEFKSLHFTPEMVIFGTVGAKVNTFGIEPSEPTLTHGQTVTFKTSRPITGVKWSAVNLDGSTAGAGTMDPNSGVYTAPSLAQMGAPYKRVKIIATGPLDNQGERHISRALAVIVSRSLALNPAIEIIPATNPDDEVETRMLSAHSNGGELRWSVEGEGSIDPSADANGKNEYRAPLKQTGFPSFTIDKVKVKNLATDQEQTSLMVIRHSPPALVINFDHQGLPDNQVKLVAKMNGTEPEGGLVWECMPADAGSVDPVTRVFTASSTTSSPFVLISVLFEIPAIKKKFDGFTIVPLPVKTLPPRPTPTRQSI